MSIYLDDLRVVQLYAAPSSDSIPNGEALAELIKEYGALSPSILSDYTVPYACDTDGTGFRDTIEQLYHVVKVASNDHLVFAIEFINGDIVDLDADTLYQIES